VRAALAHQRADAQLGREKRDPGHAREVCDQRNRPRGAERAAHTAGDHAEAVGAVQAREQGSGAAALELHALDVQGDVDEAVGDPHDGHRGHEPGE
jgi:hypothetical protein